MHFYGIKALEEGLLYNFSRVDHRHNYSMHWYWIYLARGAAADVAQEQPWIIIPWVGRVLLVPQLVILVYSSFTLAVNDLALALFVQTFAFVAFNKVGQFTDLCGLLPLYSLLLKSTCCWHCFAQHQPVLSQHLLLVRRLSEICKLLELQAKLLPKRFLRL